MDTGGTFHALLIAVEVSQLDVISTCHVAISKEFPVLLIKEKAATYK